MESKTTLDTLYLVNTTRRKVNLDIKVGDQGQTSLLTVRLEKAVLIENHQGNLMNFEIGKNNDLNGKALKMEITITDTSRKTNLTFVNIKVSGGLLSRNYPLYKTVDKEGDSADYYCNIDFFKP